MEEYAWTEESPPMSPERYMTTEEHNQLCEYCSLARSLDALIRDISALQHRPWWRRWLRRLDIRGWTS